ncbi:MAG: histidine--tRNA ligase [Candidatus Eisenbacteria bacterium]|nr:histidine--tRNA ligase [Candidatus Eisenbacteria bacterium]
MARIQAIRGTQDRYGGALLRWRVMEERVRAVADRFGYEEIRTPLFEATELFSRGVGMDTDIVQKEMYTFADRKGRSLTLRPEGTASVVRAYLEHGMARERPIAKFFYMGPMFRYERPQKGRFREFHQFGVEVIGSDDPLHDAETVAVFIAMLEDLGLSGLTVRLGSVGDGECRPAYTALLRSYLKENEKDLCETCRERIDRNPLRVLDCKADAGGPVIAGAPSILEHLCGGCRDHLDRVGAALGAAGIPYTHDAGLVRGLDYYTRTVYEVHHERLGAQSALGGGGRYDRLVEDLGGPATPGVGFSAGMERIADVASSLGVEWTGEEPLRLFVAPLDGAGEERVFPLLLRLRRRWRVEGNYRARNLKTQLKHAVRFGARFVLLIGEEEAAADAVSIKRLDTGDQTRVKAADLEREIESLASAGDGDDRSRKE